jgi:single-strand DNA-binding protein
MLNKIQFIGHLGRDPETRYLPDGMAVCNFPVASSEKWKDKSTGEKKERTEWLRCNAFDRLAEICDEYLKKGSLVYVEGKLQTREYTDKDGIKRYATECRINEMKMLGGRPEREEQNTSAPEQRRDPAPRAAQGQRPRPADQAEPRQSTGFDDMNDDIPF